jgi:hypothetical protein
MDALAITIRSDGLLTRIISPVTVRQSEAYCKINGLNAELLEAKAMWDTGSTGCCISQRLAAALALISVDSWNLTSVHDSKSTNVYLLDIILPDKTTISNLTVVEIDSTGAYDVIIGMNIIGLGDFALSNDHGKTLFSFRLPAGSQPIDFTKIEAGLPDS